MADRRARPAAPAAPRLEGTRCRIGCWLLAAGRIPMSGLHARVGSGVRYEFPVDPACARRRYSSERAVSAHGFMSAARQVALAKMLALEPTRPCRGRRRHWVEAEPGAHLGLIASVCFSHLTGQAPEAAAPSFAPSCNRTPGSLRPRRPLRRTPLLRTDRPPQGPPLPAGSGARS